MPADKQDIQQRLQQLRAQYAAKLPDRIASLEQQWLALNLADTASKQYETLVREFHSLAGSGSSYGFPQVSTLAREIETALQEVKTSSAQEIAQLKAKINTKLTSLKLAATSEPH